MSPVDGGPAEGWTVVQRTLLPGEGPDGAAALYVRGVGLTWTRDAVTIPSRATASFATYFGAFPAGVWRAGTTVERVRLEAIVDGTASLTVRATDRRGSVRTLDTISDATGTISVDLALADDLGWIWFEATAGTENATVSGATWSAYGPAAADGTAAICITTFNRESDCVRLLGRLASDPFVTRLLGRVFVVDQGTRHVSDEPGLDEARKRLEGRLNLIEQANLGGSGGFSRGMLDAADGPERYALLLDDDVDLEPESIARMLAFAAFARQPTIVGAHMLSLLDPTALHSWGERVVRRSFWWAPVDADLAPVDVAASTIENTPALSEPHEVDFNGWWMCLVPTATIRAIGASLPLFIKWDDAEYGLRAAAAGVPTVTLPGAALWHIPWTGKDNALDWQSYFQLRNRLVAALIHSPERTGSGVLAATFAQDVNHLLCLQYGSLRARHLAIRDVLDGPSHLPRTIASRRGDVQKVLAASDQLPIAADALPPVLHRSSGSRRAGASTLARAAFHQLRRSPRRSGPVQTSLGADQGKWWRLGLLDSAAVASAGGTGWFVFRRDRAAAFSLLRDSVVLHLRLLVTWRRLERSYRSAAPQLAGPASWRRLFGGDGPAR